MAARSSTTFQASWHSGKTLVIRVPEVLAEAVLAHARYLDHNLYAHSAQTTIAGKHYETQIPDPMKPVNVAKVAQRSPFRYPGGKTWLIPFLRGWVRSLPAVPSLFIEPFAGGAIASLSAAAESWTNHVLMAESDEAVAAVWRTILSSQAEWLAQRILRFELTEESVKKLLLQGAENKAITLKEKAFLTILQNRVQRGGIMAPGAGLVKKGENNKGLASRWYPETLARRIRDIQTVRDRISFHAGDGFDIISDYASDETVVFYIDPPYTKAAKRLYNHWDVDHAQLFSRLSRARASFLMSYDDTQEIRDLAEQSGLQYRKIRMKNTHHAKKCELLIARKLDWLDAPEGVTY